MQFTYDSYRNLIILLKNKDYVVSSYHNWEDKKRCVILRHDIDYELSKAVEIAEIEKTMGVNSTFFVLLTSDFYNVFSKKSCNVLKGVLSLGHEIGLHFDEVRYPQYYGNTKRLKEKIEEEAKLLELAIDAPVKTVSMHRPSKEMLEANLKIPGIVNSYGDIFFKEFKYLSDSRKRWREPVEEIIQSQKFDKLHILTHAFWYEKEEIDIHDSLEQFVNHANRTRYESLADNITDLNSVMRMDEVAGR